MNEPATLGAHDVLANIKEQCPIVVGLRHRSEYRSVRAQMWRSADLALYGNAGSRANSTHLMLSLACSIVLNTLIGRFRCWFFTTRVGFCS